MALDRAVGRQLSRDLVTPDGRVWLRANLILTEGDVRAIRRRLGLTLVEVRHELLPDLPVDEADLNAQVRAQAVQAVAEAVHAVGHRVPPKNAPSLLRAATSILEATLSMEGALTALTTLRSQDDALLQHSVNTAVYAVMIGYAYRLRRSDLLRLSLGGLMHDLGKALIPVDILRKPGRLTPEEYTVMKEHPRLGYEALQVNYPRLAEDVGRMVYEHHERMDGSGYPEGRSGEAIDRLTRMVVVADVFDALCAVRPYKPGWAPHRAAKYLRRHPNLFDGEVVWRFLRQVALYPTGTLVLMANRALGVVVGQDPAHPEAPAVLVVADRAHRPVTPEVVSRASQPQLFPLAGSLRDWPPGLVERIDRGAVRGALDAYAAARHRAVPGRSRQEDEGIR